MTTNECVQLWIEAAVAVGTLLAVGVAIWGDWIRSVLAPPKLTLHLRDPEGELTIQNDKRKVRYYHLDVSNDRGWTRARNVDVYLKNLEILGPDREWRSTMVCGPIPLRWQFGMAPSFIGHPRICDLGAVVEGGAFQLTTLFVPNNLLAGLEGLGQLRVHLVALADNAESCPYVIDISWDGIWVDGTSEFAAHLVVKEVELRSGAG